MKIDQFRLGHRYRDRAEQDLTDLLNQPTDKQLRPCPDCRTPCACPSHSPTCCCGCTAACPQAARKLSSEGDRFPIEPKVLPLVYALNTLKLIQPCWSCEGHNHSSGELWKPPAVWFYAASSEIAALVSEHLFSLQIKKALATKWEVLVTHIPSHGVIYQLQPAAEEVAGVPLNRLQDDLAVIAKDLPNRIKRLAEMRLR